MTVFVYISRRPKVFNRPKKRLYIPPKPSNLSWKKPLRPRGRPTRVWRAYQRRIHLRYQPNPPPPSNLSWKIPLRRRWQSRRFVAKLFVQQRRGRLRYQPNPPPPAGFAPTKHAFRIRIRRGKRFVKTPKLYSIAGPPAGLIPTKHAFRIRIRRGKRFIKIPRLYSIAGPPASFVAVNPRRRLRLHSRPMARFFRPRARGAIVPPPLVLFRTLRRLRLKRRVLRGPRVRYPVMAAPVGFVPFKKPPRPKIRRARIRVRPRNYSILPSLLLLFRKPPRVRIKRARRFVLPHRYPNMDPPAGFAPFVPERVLQLHSRPLLRFFRSHTRPYPIAGLPVGFIAFKKPPRPKIRRARIRVRPRTYPFVTALLVMYRALRRLKIKRAHLRVRPRAYSIAGPPVGFIAFKRPPRAKIRRFRIRLRPRSYPIVTAILVLYRALRRLKIKRGKRFIKFPRLYSISGPPTGFIAFKKPPRAKVRRWRSSLRQFAKRLYSFEGIAPPPPPIVLPPAGGGKRKRKTRAEIEHARKAAVIIEQARQALSPGDKARSEIAKKLRRAVKSEGLLITEEEMFLLLHALEDDDED